MRIHLLFITILLCSARLMAADDEFYVLYRGFHYTPSQLVPNKDDIPVNRQDCLAPYTHFAQIDNVSALQNSTKLQSLHKSGCFQVNNQAYPSLYDWMQQYYVNEYAQFKDDLQKPASQLRQNLKLYCKLSPDNIFLISTSLNPVTALKYSAGMCSPQEFRKFPISEHDGVKTLTDPILGFLDIFVISAKEITTYYPYFVVEEFALHHIDIPYKFKQTDYTLAEEVNFPFYIPGKYHYVRIAIDVASFKKPKKNPERWGNDRWMSEQFHQYGSKLDAFVTKRIEQLRKQRVFLGPLTRLLQGRINHLKPSDAVEVRNAIMIQILQLKKQSFNFLTRTITTAPISLDIYTAYALEKLAHMGFKLMVTFKRVSFEKDIVELLPILIKESNLVNINLPGEDEGGIWQQIEEKEKASGGLPTDYYNQPFPLWRKAHDSMEIVLSYLKKRKTKIILDITGQSLDPEDYAKLVDMPDHIDVIDKNRSDDEQFAEEDWKDASSDLNLHKSDLDDERISNQNDRRPENEENDSSDSNAETNFETDCGD